MKKDASTFLLHVTFIIIVIGAHLHYNGRVVYINKPALFVPRAQNKLRLLFIYDAWINVHNSVIDSVWKTNRQSYWSEESPGETVKGQRVLFKQTIKSKCFVFRYYNNYNYSRVIWWRKWAAVPRVLQHGAHQETAFSSLALSLYSDKGRF